MTGLGKSFLIIAVRETDLLSEKNAKILRNHCTSLRIC